jgi:predicted nucleic acid-binding protein
MEAYHDIYHLHSNTLCLTLPESFYPRHQTVEIIILPVDESTHQESSPADTLTEFQKFLLNSTEMSGQTPTSSTMERICLDTNVLIDHKRAKKSAKANTFLFRLASGHSQLAISTITAYELLRGDNQDEDQYWHQMFENLQVLPLDLAVCQTAAGVYKDLKSRSLLIRT